MSAASWSALLRFASDPSNEVCLGVNGFGSFSRRKRTSVAGPKPGIIKNHHKGKEAVAVMDDVVGTEKATFIHFLSKGDFWNVVLLTSVGQDK